MKLTFEIEPITQLRPRYTSRPFPHAYDVPKVKTYKAKINGMARKMMFDAQREPFNGALQIKVAFYRSIQKSVGKAEHARRDTGQILPAVKPDLDNYVKALFDALNGVVWEDDNLITDIQASKRYSNKPRIELEVNKING